MAINSEVVLSEIEPGDRMAQAVLARMRLDYDWRNRWLSSSGNNSISNSTIIDDTAFDRAAELFEALTSDSDSDDIPRVNLIHKAVEDFLSVAITNIPRATLHPKRFIGGAVEEWEVPIRIEIINMAVEVMNAFVKSILLENHYDDLIQRIVTHSAIFGVGYMYTENDTSLDTRKSYEVRDLVNADRDLSADEVERLSQLTNRVQLKAIDPRDIFWRHSVRDVKDEEMLRVSVVEQMDTKALRQMWKDSPYVEDAERQIVSGNLPFFIRASDKSTFFTTNNTDSTTSVVTMYELELMPMSRTVDTEDGGEMEFEYDDWIMHKITLAGRQLVDYEQWDSSEGPLRLPVNPIYLRKSVNHPYGWSLPLMLERSEEYINAVQSIIFQSALRAVSSQGVAIAVPNMGEEDLEELEHVLEHGGVARITGNNAQGPIDIRDMVMPMNFTQSSINPALVEAMSMQMSMFGTQSQEVDAGAISDARSGAAKRAQIAVADRPKTISINMMSEGIEDIYDNIYELIRIYHNEEVVVTVDTPGGPSDQVTLNEPYSRNVLIMDEKEISPENPLGIRSVVFETTLNSTLIDMRAKSDGRSDLPTDLISRYQMGAVLVQTQAIQPETFREFVLGANDTLKAFDDAVIQRKKDEALEQFLIQQAAQQQQAQQQGPQAGFTPDSFGGIAPQDQAADQQAQIDSVQGSPFASPSNPLAG